MCSDAHHQALLRRLPIGRGRKQANIKARSLTFCWDYYHYLCGNRTDIGNNKGNAIGNPIGDFIGNPIGQMKGDIK